ncbi:MAG: imelysin family protein [Bacteroidota bacterium]|nr:imelysin family protein [Bacteroidota bacterium]MDP3144266.1 imelysin family protein [Bacteroidota bacterium]
MLKKLLLTFLVFTLVFCKKKPKTVDEDPAESFDKQGMLTNIADNVIIPSYTVFKISLDSLSLAFNTFNSSNSLIDFQKVKSKFNVVYLNYQRISLFEFGPAETNILRMNLNVFPTDSVQIKSNVANGSYDLSSAINFDAKGLPALDYLFYGKNQNEVVIVQSFSTTPNRKQYVTDLINDMSVKVNSIVGSWNGTYRSQFINSLNTDIGSSIGFLVNQLNFELDFLKNNKIGIPLGKKTLGIPEPTKCEAYYGEQSVQYAVETLHAIENVYLGRSQSGNDGKGFDDYLEHLKSQYNGQSLNVAINNQFSIAKTKLAAIQNPLSSQVISNVAVVDAAYLELLKLLVLLKTDMPSSLGVIITYQDGDGD